MKKNGAVLRLPTLCQNLEYVESGREVAARSPGRTRTSGWFLDRRQSGERKPRAQEKPATRGGGRSWLELSIGGAPRSCPTSLVLLGPEPCNPVYYWSRGWMACSALSERWVETHRIAVPCRLPHLILSNHPKSLFFTLLPHQRPLPLDKYMRHPSWIGFGSSTIRSFACVSAVPHLWFPCEPAWGHGGRGNHPRVSGMGPHT
jgi:hypothetical protein